MAIARLPAGVLSHLGDYLDDAGLCMHASSERDRWAHSARQRQARKDGQLQFLLLSGVAECASDCDRACELLSGDAIAPFVGECTWGEGGQEPDPRFHVNFRASRRDLPLLCRAVETFLDGLRALIDAHLLRETLTFSDEFTGMRLMDDGACHRIDIPRRVLDKVTRQCRRARPWDMDSE